MRAVQSFFLRLVVPAAVRAAVIMAVLVSAVQAAEAGPCGCPSLPGPAASRQGRHQDGHPERRLTPSPTSHLKQVQQHSHRFSRSRQLGISNRTVTSRL